MARRKKKRSKTDSLRVHATRRAYQRYGVELNPQDLDEMVSVVRQGHTEHLESQSHRVTVHGVVHRESKYYVVYDKRRKEIVTFLTPEMVGRG